MQREGGPIEAGGKLHRLFEENFIDYSSYVIRERAIPDVDDGLKPVQRRILQTLANMDDGRYHKVANVVGETMKLHPHGDASIFAALVNLANKELLIDRQGNFGNVFTGDQASAARYIECRLTPLARATLFNPDLTTFTESYDGRAKEPVSLPAKIPLLLLLGAEGIAVGMATRILPHNFVELLQAQIAILRGEPFNLLPDFPQGGILDAGGYEQGNGRVLCRARLDKVDEHTIVVRELPYGLTTQALIDSVEKAARAGKLKLQSINDYTAETVEVEIKLPRGADAEEAVQALYAFTDCELAIVPNLMVIRQQMPVCMGVDEVLQHNSDKLLRDLKKELTIERDRLQERLHGRLLEQIFIEERLYKGIEEITSQKLILSTIQQSLAPFLERLVRQVTKEDIERLLEIRIRRISRYDINRQRKEIDEIRAAIRLAEKRLQELTAYAISILEGFVREYGEHYPRRTELASFHGVAARDLATADLTLCYHRESGFLGHQLKCEEETATFSLQCSEFDRVLLIFRDGSYRVIHVPDKVFIGHEVLWLGLVDDNLVFNLIYRDGTDGLSYLKRFRMPKFIVNREYRLYTAHPRSTIQLLTTGEEGEFKAQLAPSARSRHNSLVIRPAEYLVKGVAAHGRRLSGRPVRRIISGAAPSAPALRSLPGVG
ncbi:MAG: DNA topoisomerase IV [Desulfobulbaceae bacterium A2]|nr:MAG: DNA topoisomerase IV [Desulfobulbaceae bacterium A2]